MPDRRELLAAHRDAVVEGPVLQVREAREDGAARREVEAAGQVDVALLPEGEELVGPPRAGRVHLHALQGDGQISAKSKVNQRVSAYVPLTKAYLPRPRIGDYTPLLAVRRATVSTDSLQNQ